MKKLLLVSIVFILSLLSMLNIISIPSYELSTVSVNASESESESDEEKQLCPICLEEVTNEVTTHCNHTFCKQCLDEWISTSLGSLEDYLYRTHAHAICPLCRADILTVNNANNSINNNSEREAAPTTPPSTPTYNHSLPQASYPSYFDDSNLRRRNSDQQNIYRRFFFPI